MAESAVDEWSDANTQSKLEVRQYYIHYWHGISKDQINYDIFYFGSRLPTKQEASRIIERAIRIVGGGYWELVEDATVPPEKGVLFRDNEELIWGWETGIQVQPEKISPDQVLIRKFKIEDWLDHPEPQHPKEKTAPKDKVVGRL
jgi:hypothetical protein